MYRNAPVVLVALEVRHPSAGTFSPTHQRRAKQSLASDLPLLRMGRRHDIQQIGSSTPIVQTEKFPRFLSRDSTLSVSFLDTRFVVETTRYQGWPHLKQILEQAAEVRAEVGGMDGIERIGLRYVNEIRVPEETETDWEGWVDPTLLGASAVGRRLSLATKGWQGVTLFSPSADHSIVVRYGPATGYAVDPSGDLKRPTAGTPGPFFMLDIDSYWTPDDSVPEFDPRRVVEIAEEIHTPVDRLFEGLITDQLREVLRGNVRA